jgi:myo-inositol-1-phosphate synthase
LSTLRVAIAGIGNCASALVQGVHFYRNADPARSVPGLMHVDLGGIHVGDIAFSAAFDIAEGKVGRDLAERSAPVRTTPSASPIHRSWM